MYCARCHAAINSTLEISNTELSDCDRCGHVGPATTQAKAAVQPPEKVTKRFFGLGSWTFLLLCTLTGSAAFSFLYASGQGWKDARVTQIQTPLCEFLNCLHSSSPAQIPQPEWLAETLAISPLGPSSSRIQAQVLAQNPNAKTPPSLKLTLFKSNGDVLSRTLLPSQYQKSIDSGEFLVAIQVPHAEIARIQWQTLASTEKTTAQLYPSR